MSCHRDTTGASDIESLGMWVPAFAGMTGMGDPYDSGLTNSVKVRRLEEERVERLEVKWTIRSGQSALQRVGISGVG
jgi:hypothetical protein